MTAQEVVPMATKVESPPAEKPVEKTAAVRYPTANIQLVNRFIDDVRPIRVSIIGAGLSGILAGTLIPAKVPNVKLTIYEKNADVSGTWLENIYPGVRCDIPSHVYQSTFTPNTQWSDEFSYGAEIRDYWQSVAKKYNVYNYLRPSHRVDDLSWDANTSLWSITVTDLTTNTTYIDIAEVVITAIGRFNAWKLPDIPGLRDFTGHLRHASNWDPSFDPTGKTVAIIGNGASGIQLVANLQKKVKHLDHYARNPTWIATSWAGDERSANPQPYSEEQKKEWAQDPSKYLAFRKAMESRYWRRVNTWFRGSPESLSLKDSFKAVMRRRLSKKLELAEVLTPDFSPNCRRLTPGPGYLEALTEDNVTLVRGPITKVTATGIESAAGYREVDAIICATGAHIDMIPPFPIRAFGKTIRDLWSHNGEHGFPYSYLGVATPGFPNLFFLQGPHGTGPAGTVPHAAETQATYLARILRKIALEGIRTIVPSKAATDEFVEYSDAFFGTTVLAEECSSWYNGGRPGARIHGIWPGSAGHLTVARREPRWEDFEYSYLGPQGNRWGFFLGNGRTKREGEDESDVTRYLKLGEADLRAVHEEWWEVL